MKFKITNNKLNDSLIIEAGTISICREKTNLELTKRGWNPDDCHSEKILPPEDE